LASPAFAADHLPVGVAQPQGFRSGCRCANGCRPSQPCLGRDDPPTDGRRPCHEPSDWALLTVAPGPRSSPACEPPTLPTTLRCVEVAQWFPARVDRVHPLRRRRRTSSTRDARPRVITMNQLPPTAACFVELADGALQCEGVAAMEFSVGASSRARGGVRCLDTGQGALSSLFLHLSLDLLQAILLHDLGFLWSLQRRRG